MRGQGPRFVICKICSRRLQPAAADALTKGRRLKPAATESCGESRATGEQLSVLLGSLLLLGFADRAWAQVPLDLAARKPFRALRLASTDPKFKNADYRRIAPGETLELGKIEGHGRITHMWFTIAAKSENHLQELVLRTYWDGAEKPAIECPLGDFYGLGFGKYVEYRSAPIAIGGVKRHQLLLADALLQGSAADDDKRGESAGRRLLFQY